MSATAPEARIALLDVLRGFALLGVLLVNIQYFAEPRYDVVMADGGWGLPDQLGIWFVELFAVSKFYPIFSFLFGYGAALQQQSAAARGTSFAPFFAWRMTLLLLIGAFHQIYIWSGDILATYAMLGFVLLLFVRASDRVVLGAAVAATFAVTLTLAGLRLWLDLDAPADAAAALQARFAELGDPWRRVTRQTLRIFGMFLLGFYAGRRGWIRDDAPEDPARLSRLAGWALAAGLAGNVAWLVLAERSDESRLTWTWVLDVGLLAAAGPLLATGYVAAVARWFRTPRGRRALAPLAAVGRTALSNYLLQSFAGLALVGEYGVARFVGPTHPPVGIALAFAVFAVQVWLSVWWLRRFRFGPVEWAWRSATYGAFQKFRVDQPPAEPARS